MLARKYFHFDITLIVIAISFIAVAIETDIFIPSFPTIQAHFNISESMTQMILSINFMGLCLSSLFYGPLSDAYGRRPLLLIGMVLFLVASIGCIFAQSIEGLLFWRFVQGLGASSTFVVAGAMVFDLYTKEEAAKILGFYTTLVTLSMSAAPMIGSYLNIHYSWRANFIFVGILSFIAFTSTFFFLKESLPKEQRAVFHFGEICRNFGRLLTNRQIIMSLTIMCAVFAAYMIYIANLSLLFMNHLGVEEHIYPLYQGVILAVFAVVSITMSSWIKWLGLHKTRVYGQLCTFVGGIALMLVAIFWPENPILITLTMCIFTVGFALMINIVWGDYMSVFPELKGLASALCTSVRLIVTAAAIGFSGFLFNGTIVPIATLVLIFSILATIALVLQLLD